MIFSTKKRISGVLGVVGVFGFSGISKISKWPKVSRVFFVLGFVLNPWYVNTQTLPFANQPTRVEHPKNFLGSFTSGESNQNRVKSDSSKNQSRKKIFFVGLQIAAQFAEFSQQDFFTEDLQAIIDDKFTRDTSQAGSDTNFVVAPSRIVQPYDPVQMIFPLGIFAGVSLSENLEFRSELQAFWFEQESILETYPLRDQEDPKTSGSTLYKYGMHTWLLGAGLKYYFPTDFITVDKGHFLFISFTNFWDIGLTEFYGQGLATGKPTLWGVGNETSVGFHIFHKTKIQLLGQISFSNLEFENKGLWSQVTLEPQDERMVWNLNSLKFNFQLVYPLLFLD